MKLFCNLCPTWSSGSVLKNTFDSLNAPVTIMFPYNMAESARGQDKANPAP